MLTIQSIHITAHFYGKTTKRILIGPALTQSEIAIVTDSLIEGHSLDWALALVGAA